MNPQLLIAQAPYSVDSADFDGTNDYMLRGGGLTGASDSKSGILSVWVRLDAGTGTQRLIGSSVSVGTAADRWLSSRISASGPFLVAGRNAAGTLILQIVSDTSYAAAATWLHLLVSWDLAAAAAHLYVNDVADIAAGPTLTDDTLDYTVGDWGIGGDSNAGSKLDGCLAELYFAPGQFLDFSTLANRRKFIDAYGRPVYLGATGQAPTGTAPLVYQRLFKSQPVDEFDTNSGTGGAFTITGTLTVGSTSPSD